MLFESIPHVLGHSCRKQQGRPSLPSPGAQAGIHIPPTSPIPLKKPSGRLGQAKASGSPFHLEPVPTW